MERIERTHDVFCAPKLPSLAVHEPLGQSVQRLPDGAGNRDERVRVAS